MSKHAWAVLNELALAVPVVACILLGACAVLWALVALVWLAVR